jgi:hypothetical protein
MRDNLDSHIFVHFPHLFRAELGNPNPDSMFLSFSMHGNDGTFW